MKKGIINNKDVVQNIIESFNKDEFKYLMNKIELEVHNKIPSEESGFKALIEPKLLEGAIFLKIIDELINKINEHGHPVIQNIVKERFNND